MVNIVGVVSIHQSIAKPIRAGTTADHVVVVRFTFELDLPKLVVQILEGGISIYGRRR